MDNLQVVCDIIILIGAVLAAIGTICSAFGKPIQLFRKRKEKLEAEKTALITASVTKGVIDKLTPKFEEIADQNDDQRESIEKLTNSTRDMLREHILTIYERRKAGKKLTILESEVLDKLFADYSAEGGNGHIKKIYEIMSKWDVVDEDDI